eukprot:TRINITY_DN32030_c0_g1_i1.p1 TRINITY_DN32030_c0_g1~~TRINITY_DN32030_c0_g1_i1.p1  ORF type:complete len:1250 (+),score=272.04 TRINITY_DN32030_c0_g1_i1:69-3752(+)
MHSVRQGRPSRRADGRRKCSRGPRRWRGHCAALGVLGALLFAPAAGSPTEASSLAAAAATRSDPHSRPEGLAGGRVMRELAQRLLTRGQGTRGVVVALGADAAASPAVTYAEAEGHTVLRIPNASARLDDSNRQAAILLLYVDPGTPGDGEAALAGARELLAAGRARYVVCRFSTAAAVALQAAQYRVQVLAATHAMEGFGANVLLGPGNLLPLARAASALGATIYLFATRGLDLAIPSRREFLNLSWGHFCGGDIVPRGGECDGSMPLALPIAACPATPLSAGWGPRGRAALRCSGGEAKEAEWWYSSPDDQNAEIVCARARCEGRVHSACATRMLPPAALPPIPESAPDRADLLLVTLGSMSRAHFRRALPLTSMFLEGDVPGYHYFRRYAPAASGRDEPAADGAGPRVRWLWERLASEAGYVTLVAGDKCGARSSRMAHHGRQLQGLMCFDYARPNCAAGKLAAQWLTDYFALFARQYHIPGKAKRRPWAAFLHFADAQEDSMALAAAIDRPLLELLQAAHGTNGAAERAIVVIASDHGIDYGTYYQTAAGRRAFFEPVLWMHLPGLVRLVKGAKVPPRNLEEVVTARDVYRTLVALTGLRRDADSPQAGPSAGRTGASLIDPLPAGRSCAAAGAAAEACAPAPGPPSACVPLPMPPSMLSFYSDIPLDRKPVLAPCRPQKPRSALRGDTVLLQGGQRRCWCTTNLRPWMHCGAPHRRFGSFGGVRSTHRRLLQTETDEPGTFIESNFQLKDEEDFVVVTCGRQTDVHLRVVRPVAIAQRTERARQRASQAVAAQQVVDWGGGPAPSVLVIELDSVSVPYSERHFPRSRAVLARRDLAAGRGQVASFERFNSVAAASVGNQMALMSGCFARMRNANVSELHMVPVRLHKEISTRKHRQWCSPPPSFRRSGPRGVTETLPSPWLFDAAKAQGYVTWFGEEFCTTGSPFVIQGNFFDLDASFDHRFDMLYCRLGEFEHRRKNLFGRKAKDPDKWRAGRNPQEACMSGRNRHDMALSQLRNLWTAHGDAPKFAWYNSVVAHNYSTRWSTMAINAEAMDGFLASFLEDLLSGRLGDPEDTVVVIRGDHGLQGGPTTVDYATQIEQRRPWTNLIVPQRLLRGGGASVATLRTNTGRLATGFDLYRTLLRLIQPGAALPHPPVWSYDLLRDVIPLNRTCAAARIAADFCGCGNEHTGTSPATPGGSPHLPNNGVCNFASAPQDEYCVGAI